MNRVTQAILLSLLVFAEQLCHGLTRGATDLTWASIIYIMSGIALVIVLLYPVKVSTHISRVSYNTSVLWICAILLGLMFHHYTSVIIETIPVDYKLADMLPVLSIMSLRFIEGEAVYDLIPHIWDGIQPIYLPALWLPFTLHHILDIDPRWMASCSMLLGSICSLFILSRSKLLIGLLAVSLAIFHLWTTLWVTDRNIIGLTQEGIVIGYYMILGYALVSRRWILFGVAIGCCMMSRYILATWVICYLVFIVYHGMTKPAIRISVAALCTTVFFLLLGSTYEQLDLFTNLPDHYLSAVLSDEPKFSLVIQGNLGLAKFCNYQSLGSLLSLQQFFFVSVPIIGFALYNYCGRYVSLSLYALCVLKLSLVFFYNLIIIPYSYLFYTSTFLSIVLLATFYSELKELDSPTDTAILR